MKSSWLRLAKKAITKEKIGGHQVCALCIGAGGKIISVGVNSYIKSHTKQAYYSKKVNQPASEYLHAEVAAIIRAGRQKIYKIAVIRFNKKGETACAKPCDICELAIQEAGIRFVEHTI